VSIVATATRRHAQDLFTAQTSGDVTRTLPSPEAAPVAAAAEKRGGDEARWRRRRGDRAWLCGAGELKIPDAATKEAAAATAAASSPSPSTVEAAGSTVREKSVPDAAVGLWRAR